MINCIAFRPNRKNTLCGFADFEFTKIGLVIRDCTWHKRSDKEWVSFPAKCYTDPNGEQKWKALLEFTDVTLRATFQDLALEAIHRVVEEHRRDYGKGEINEVLGDGEA